MYDAFYCIESLCVYDRKRIHLSPFVTFKGGCNEIINEMHILSLRAN